MQKAKGETYDGEWYQDMRHGIGLWTQEGTQFRYMGMWKNNRPEGYGILKSQEGDIYEGQFKNGLKHGKGIEKFHDGAHFVGNLRNGQPDGQGKYKSAHGSLYVGGFLMGRKHGYGKWTMPNSIQGQLTSNRVTEYEGMLVNGCI